MILLKLDFLDKLDFKDVPMLKMVDNNHGDLPFYIRRYTIKNANTRLHRHEYMQINYVYQGKAKHLVNNSEFEIIKGDIFVIPPYIPHKIIGDGTSGAEIYEFEFIPEFINQNFTNIHNTESFLDFAYIEPFLVSENLVKPRLNLVGKIQVEIEHILNEVINEYAAKKSGYDLLIRSLLLKLLVLVGREFSAELQTSETSSLYDRHRDSISGAVKYIDEHYAEDLKVEYVAKEFMLSQSYFSYLFKSITAKTFIEYLNGLRISKAQELLANTDKKVIDICYEVGFHNVNHFNRIFRQFVGLSPLIYRKKSKQLIYL
jgi:AraC-like DNA-binding protein